MERTENTITLIIKVKKTDEAKKTVERLMLDESIISIMSENDELIKNAASEKITNVYRNNSNFKQEALSLLMRKLNFLPSHSGFHYFLTAVEYKVSCPMQELGIAKYIYPYVAKVHSSTPARVERCMRKAIDHAWNCNGDVLFQELTSCNLGKKPTNSQFISLIAEYIIEHRSEFYY